MKQRDIPKFDSIPSLLGKQMPTDLIMNMDEPLHEAEIKLDAVSSAATSAVKKARDAFPRGRKLLAEHQELIRRMK